MREKNKFRKCVKNLQKNLKLNRDKHFSTWPLFEFLPLSKLLLAHTNIRFLNLRPTTDLWRQVGRRHI